jgi:hypothetical protein
MHIGTFTHSPEVKRFLMFASSSNMNFGSAVLVRRLPAAEERTLHVHGEQAVELLLADLGPRLGEHHRGVVHQDIGLHRKEVVAVVFSPDGAAAWLG